MASTSEEGTSEESGSNMLKPGTTILTCEPFVYSTYIYLKSEGSDCQINFCDTCLTIKDKNELRRCSSCKEVRYCNRTCQEKGWKDGHKYECKGIPKLLLVSRLNCKSESDVRERVRQARVILRVIAKLQDGNDYYDEVEIGGKLVRLRFADLPSYEDDENFLPRMRYAAIVLKVLLGSDSKSKIKLPSDAELLEIVTKVCCNSYVIGDGFHNVGSGVYFASSIFNHSCSPMAVWMFDGPRMRIRNIVPIPKSLSIDQVKITMICILEPSQVRRKKLKLLMNILCECEKCKTGQFDKDMRSVICSRKGCNAKIDTEDLKNPCGACGNIMRKEVVAKILETEQNIARMFDDGAYKGLPLIETGIEKMKSVNFSDSHWLMIWLLHEAYAAAKLKDSHGNFVSAKKAYEYGAKYIVEARRYSAQYDLQLTWMFLEMSSFALYMGQLDEAERYMIEGKSMGDILHGKDSQVWRKRIDPLQERIEELKITTGMNGFTMGSVKA